MEFHDRSRGCVGARLCIHRTTGAERLLEVVVPAAKVERNAGVYVRARARGELSEDLCQRLPSDRKDLWLTYRIYNGALLPSASSDLMDTLSGSSISTCASERAKEPNPRVHSRRTVRRATVLDEPGDFWFKHAEKFIADPPSLCRRRRRRRRMIPAKRQ